MLSIIIPTYNEENYLPLLLESIKQQRKIDHEIIIADNDSTDDTRQIAKQYGCRITEGGLPSVGRNTGATCAKGGEFLFLDADVALDDPTFLDAITNEFRYRGYDVAACEVNPISARKIDKVMHGAYNLFMRMTARTKPVAPGSCILAKRSMHELIDGFDERVMLAEDADYVRRAYEKGGSFGVLRSRKVPVSVRRFDRDGRPNVAMKYILCCLHMKFLGIVKSNAFNYTFGYSSNDKNLDFNCILRKDENTVNLF